MHTDSVSVAFLHSLQRDLLGPADQTHGEIDGEVMRLLRNRLAGEGPGAVLGAGTLLEQPPAPTPYEPAIGYSILAELADDIVKALRDVKLPQQPLVGTLPVRWPTALLLRVPHSSSHIALVDREFTIFANLLAKVCAQALLPPRRDNSVDAWQAELESGMHPALQRYLELMAAMMTASPVAAPAYLPAPELSSLLNQIRSGIELFVVSDPFVHLALGHSERASIRTLPAIHPDVESYAWTEEQRAEAFAMRLAVVSAVFERRGYPDRALGYWSIQMFLQTLALLQTAEVSARSSTLAQDGRAQVEQQWLTDVLRRNEGEESRSIALFDRLAPVPRAFARHLALAMREPEPGVH